MIHPKVKGVARLALAAAILGFLGVALASQWDRLRAQNIHFVWPYLIAAALLNVAFFIIQSEVWRRCVDSAGGFMAFRPTLAVWSASQVAKYVPGKVMLPLVRIGWSGRAGVGAAATTLGLYLEIVLMIVSSTLVFLALAGRSLAVLDTWPSWLFPALALAGLAGLHPGALEVGINAGLVRIKKDPIRLNVRYTTLLLMTAVLAAGWAIHGLSAIACVHALGGSLPTPYATLTGVFALSWLIGFLSFLTPGGLGVREGVIAVALSGWYSPETALAISLLSRLAWVLGEVLLAGATIAFRPRPKAS